LLGLSAAAQAPASSNDSSSGSSLGDYARQVRKSPSNPQKQKVFDNDNLPTDDKLSIVGPPPAPPKDDSGDAKTDSSSSTSSSAKTDSSSSTGSSDAKTSGDAKPASDAKSSDGKASADAAAKSDSKTGDKPADNTPPMKSTAKTPQQEAADKEAAKQQAIKQWTDKLTSQKEQIDLLARELDVLQREYQLRAAAMYADAGNRMRNQSDWDKKSTTPSRNWTTCRRAPAKLASLPQPATKAQPRSPPRNSSSNDSRTLTIMGQLRLSHLFCGKTPTSARSP
jgi:hypothetical protein